MPLFYPFIRLSVYPCLTLTTFPAMRLRKRANWPILVYRYWVDPEYQTWEQFPDAIRQEAEAMRALWNQLVGAFERRQAAYYQACEASAAEVSTPVQETLSAAIATRKPSLSSPAKQQRTAWSLPPGM